VLLAFEAHLRARPERRSANEFDVCNFDRLQDYLGLTTPDQIASMVWLFGALDI
jgi:hypothetical protein